MILKINIVETKGKITIRKIKRVYEVKPRFQYIMQTWSYELIYEKYHHNDRFVGTGRQMVYLFNTENEKPFYRDGEATHNMLSNISKAFIRDLKIKQILR